MYRRFEKLLEAGRRLLSADGRLDDIKVNQGRILSQLNANKGSACINDYEFKVFRRAARTESFSFWSAICASAIGRSSNSARRISTSRIVDS
jgi:hypothetical protein